MKRISLLFTFLLSLLFSLSALGFSGSIEKRFLIEKETISSIKFDLNKKIVFESSRINSKYKFALDISDDCFGDECFNDLKLNNEILINLQLEKSLFKLEDYDLLFNRNVSIYQPYLNINLLMKKRHNPLGRALYSHNYKGEFAHKVQRTG